MSGSGLSSCLPSSDSDLRLNESLVLGEYVQPVSLARASPAPGSPCVEAGWSQLGGHRKLQWGQTSLMDKQRVSDDTTDI